MLAWTCILPGAAGSESEEPPEVAAAAGAGGETVCDS